MWRREIIWLPMFLATVFLCSGCRHSQPPEISIICTMDGLGGGDCVTAAGEHKYLAPSEMKNMWATTQADMSKFSAWCYQTSIETTTQAMGEISAKIHGGDPKQEPQ